MRTAGPALHFNAYGRAGRPYTPAAPDSRSAIRAGPRFGAWQPAPARREDHLAAPAAVDHDTLMEYHEAGCSMHAGRLAHGAPAPDGCRRFGELNSAGSEAVRAGILEGRARGFHVYGRIMELALRIIRERCPPT